MQIARKPKEYFNKFPETPVVIVPFDPKSKQRALEYLVELNALLAPLDVNAELFGSTELEIAGKGEWEFAIYLTDDKWYEVLKILFNHYKNIQTLSEERALLQYFQREQEIEIIPMRRQIALKNRAIMEYWKCNSVAMNEYETLKVKYAFSKREYYWWKENYISDILEEI